MNICFWITEKRECIFGNILVDRGDRFFYSFFQILLVLPFSCFLYATYRCGNSIVYTITAMDVYWESIYKWVSYLFNYGWQTFDLCLKSSLCGKSLLMMNALSRWVRIIIFYLLVLKFFQQPCQFWPRQHPKWESNIIFGQANSSALSFNIEKVFFLLVSSNSKSFQPLTFSYKHVCVAVSDFTLPRWNHEIRFASCCWHKLCNGIKRNRALNKQSRLKYQNNTGWKISRQDL